MKTILAALVLGALAFLAPIAAVDAASRTIVLGIALMAAGIFPCMTLTVNAMKGEERSPAMVEALYDQLSKLLKVLVAGFILAVISVIALAGTSAAVAANVDEPIARAAAVGAGLVLGLFVSRVAAIGRAFFALLEINRKHSLLVARKRVRGQRDSALESLKTESFPTDDPTPREFERLT